MIRCHGCCSSMSGQGHSCNVQLEETLLHAERLQSCLVREVGRSLIKIIISRFGDRALMRC